MEAAMTCADNATENKRDSMLEYQRTATQDI